MLCPFTRIAQQADLTVVGCPELLKTWADATGLAQAVLNKVLQDIQVLAQFTPNPTMPEYQWWMNKLSNASPWRHMDRLTFHHGIVLIPSRTTGFRSLVRRGPF